MASVAPARPGLQSTASIFAGDLDAPSFPRDLAGRVALLTGLVMSADLLLPWVTINGDGIAPTRGGPLAIALLAILLAVIAPPLIPRWKRAPLTRMAPFGLGALLLGVAGTIWLGTGPLASQLTGIVTRVIEGGSALSITAPTGQIITGEPLQIAPAIGLYIFLAGAITLIICGYRILADADW